MSLLSLLDGLRCAAGAHATGVNILTTNLLRKGDFMRATHQSVILKYDDLRQEAREISYESLPRDLKSIKLEGISQKAIVASRLWEAVVDRKVDWDWSFSSRYCTRYPKAFDLSVWHGNSLLSLTFISHFRSSYF